MTWGSSSRPGPVLDPSEASATNPESGSSGSGCRARPRNVHSKPVGRHSAVQFFFRPMFSRSPSSFFPGKLGNKCRNGGRLEGARQGGPRVTRVGVSVAETGGDVIGAYLFHAEANVPGAVVGAGVGVKVQVLLDALGDVHGGREDGRHIWTG
mmetsp:Transcript_76695/g.237527  ORF Transcript_76695/g.237527 Transcript_76695/m.237527 type:complete len:153 (-) Transcript_76695:529-987(-)